ncbi:MAG: hypothetical protein RL662_2120 [Bacteroidota bacterium]
MTKTTKAWTTPQATAKLNVTPQQLAELPKGAIFQNKQGNATATAKVADDGTIEITANCDSLTLLIENLEIEEYRLQKENKALVTNINKEKTVVLSGWQNFQIWCGRILFGLFIVYIIYRKLK